jgi:hypothetical protein
MTEGEAMPLLRDAIWQFIGALLALVSIILAVWIYVLQRAQKRIAFGYLQYRRLLTVAEEVKSRVTVLLDGNPVHDVGMLICGIKNSGNVPIASSDFVGPIRLHIKNSTILSVSVPKQSPSNLAVTANTEGQTIVIQPLLLNPGDYFTVQLLLTGNWDCNIDIRAVGVSALEEARPPGRLGPKELYVITPIAALTSMTPGVILGAVLPHVRPPLWVSGLLLVACFAWFVGVTLLHRRFEKRRVGRLIIDHSQIEDSIAYR